MQLERIFSHYEQPEIFLKDTLDLLEFYADRTRRPGAATGVDDVVRAFHVPGPVLHSLLRGVERFAQGTWEQNEEVVQALWQAGYRETMLMATTAMRVQTEEIVVQWVEAYALECEDRVVLEHLAKFGLEGWRRYSEGPFLDTVSRWLGSKPHLQTLALYALQAAVGDPAFSRLPELFPLLEDWGNLRSARRKVFEQLMTGLAQRSPKETTHFLLDAVERDVKGARKLARTLKGALPPPQQQLIARSLSR